MLDTQSAERVRARILSVEKPERLQRAIEETIGLWKEVCGLPLDTLEAYGYTPDGKLSGVGFEVKDGTTSSDRKLDMHLRLEREPMLLARADEVDGSGSFRRLIISMRELIDALVPVVDAYGSIIEGACPKPNLRERLLAAKLSWMLRLLFYPPGTPPGKILGKEHTDKGFSSPHLYQEGGYMEYLVTKEPEEWRLIEERPGMVPVFGGVALQEHSDCEIIAAMHRIISDVQSELFGRVAAACFVDSVGMRFFNKLRYGAQQDQPYAYNYDYPPRRRKAFSDLFID
jgi:hypothetical protein